MLHAEVVARPGFVADQAIPPAGESLMRHLSFILIILAVLCTQSQRGTSFAQTQKEPGTITGRVQLDGKPVPSITIIATPSVSDPAKMVEQMFNSSGSLKATTDSDGIYRLEGMPAGRYRVAPSAPALVRVDVNATDEITVAEGSTTEGIDFALSRGGVITGKITDSEGRPVIGERVSLKALDKGPAPTDPQSFAAIAGDRMYATDDRGIYRIFGLRPGRYTVSAGQVFNLSTFISQHPRRVRTYYPGVTDETKAIPVEVRPGAETTSVDIQFSATDKGFIVSGRVMDSEKNTPIANAMVSYTKARTAIGKVDAADVLDMVGGMGGFSNTTTNDKGEFRFSSVAPGSYRIQASSVATFVGAGGSQFYADPITVEVEASNVEKLQIKVHHGASISGGVVVDDPDAQDTLDRYGRVALMAMVTDPVSHSYSYGSCVVATDGSFRIGGLKAGKVRFRTSSMSERKLGLIRIERNGVQVQDVEIAANEEITGVRLILMPANCEIRGRVTLQGGDLPSGATIRARARPVNSDPSDPLASETASVSPKGSFVIEEITPGSYEVEVFVILPGRSGARTVSASQVVVVTSERPAEVELVLNVSEKTSNE